jgi:2-dehydropantoate 2-reductase
MKIAIVGAGGVGGYIGAKLIHERISDITVVARGAHLQAIKAHGLHVEDEDEKFHVEGSHFTQNPAKDGPFDVVIFCTKSYDLEEAAWHMNPCIDENTLMFALCNGLNHAQTLKRIYPKNPIASACIYVLSNITEPGYIKKYGGVFLLIAGANPMPENLTKLAELFNQAKLRFKKSDDIVLECWKKYLFIAVFGALTAYYNEPIGAIVEHHHEKTKALFLEIQAIAHAKDIALSDSIIEKSLYQAREKVPYNATTSLQLDINSGKHSELEALVGSIATEARTTKTNAPVLFEIYDGLKAKIN